MNSYIWIIWLCMCKWLLKIINWTIFSKIHSLYSQKALLEFVLYVWHIVCINCTSNIIFKLCLSFVKENWIVCESWTPNLNTHVDLLIKKKYETIRRKWAQPLSAHYINMVFCLAKIWHLRNQSFYWKNHKIDAFEYRIVRFPFFA